MKSPPKSAGFYNLANKLAGASSVRALQDIARSEAFVAKTKGLSEWERGKLRTLFKTVLAIKRMDETHE